MRTLDIYIAKIIFQQTLIVFAVLLGLFSFVAFIDQLSDLGVNHYGLWDAIQYVLLSLPRTVYELFPMAALLGSILGLSLMAGDSELVIMRASGISLYRIAGSVLKIGAVFALLAMLLGELVTPTTETMAQRGRAQALQQNIKQQTNFGLWMRDTRSYVNIGEVLPDLTLLNVRIFEFDGDEKLRSLALAKEGRYLGDAWQLSDVEQTLIDEEGFASAQHLPAAAWSTVVSPRILAVFLVKADQLSIWQLNRYIKHLSDNSQDTRRYELAMWTKVFLPISTAAMVILAIPFVFQNIRSGGLGRNLVMGIMLGIGFYVANKAFGNFVLVYGIPPILGSAIPIVVFLTAALLILRRI